MVGEECGDEREAYLEVLEGRRDLPYRAFRSATDCLECDFNTSKNRWAGPTAAAHFSRCRKDSLRTRIAAALKSYLEMDASNDSLEAMRERAAVTLASYGFTEVDSIDVYEIIVGRIGPTPNGLVLNLPMLAAMDDPRTLPFVTAIYDSLRGEGLRRQREKLIAILNCIYHLSDPAAVAFAERVAESERDSLLVERARLVARRE